MTKLKIGLYRHYKNKDYLVLGIATHSETKEKFVVYRALYGKKAIWVRPLGMFKERVMLNGKKVPRFKYISK